MKTTFVNGDKAFVAEGRRHLRNEADFFKKCMKADSLEEVKVGKDETRNFYEYGLSLDYVVPGTFTDQTEGYLRYQLSWGGPSDEFRLYYSPGNWSKPYRIEYVFMNWGTGVGFDVTDQEWAQWLAGHFDDMDSVRSCYEKANE